MVSICIPQIGGGRWLPSHWYAGETSNPAKIWFHVYENCVKNMQFISEICTFSRRSWQVIIRQYQCLFGFQCYSIVRGNPGKFGIFLKHHVRSKKCQYNLSLRYCNDGEGVSRQRLNMYFDLILKSNVKDKIKTYLKTPPIKLLSQ